MLACRHSACYLRNDHSPIDRHSGQQSDINVGDTYTDLGAIVHDNQGHDLGYKTFLNGALVSTIVIDTTQVAFRHHRLRRDGHLGQHSHEHPHGHHRSGSLNHPNDRSFNNPVLFPIGSYIRYHHRDNNDPITKRY